MNEIKCIQCGKIFTSDTWNASLCSKACRVMRQRANSKRYREEEKQRKIEDGVLDGRRKNVIKRRDGKLMADLTRDAIKARKIGVTYGKYIAIYKGRTIHGKDYTV